MDEPARKRLSFWEAINFLSLNVHGERALIAGIADRLYVPGYDELRPYLHHFLDEENKHMFFFGEFCSRYADGVFPERTIALPSLHANGEEDLLFFGRAALFEELVDGFNRRLGRDERLNGLFRELNALHHFEESRHLAFGRDLVRTLYDRDKRNWSAATRADLRRRLEIFVEQSWAQLFSVRAYAAAGFERPHEVRRRALAHPAVAERRETLLAGCTRLISWLDDTSMKGDRHA